MDFAKTAPPISKEFARTFIAQECERLLIRAGRFAVLAMEYFIDGDAYEMHEHRRQAVMALQYRRDLILIRDKILPTMTHDTSDALTDAMYLAMSYQSFGGVIARAEAEVAAEHIDAFRRLVHLHPGVDHSPTSVAEEVLTPTSIDAFAGSPLLHDRGGNLRNESMFESKRGRAAAAAYAAKHQRAPYEPPKVERAKPAHLASTMPVQVYISSNLSDFDPDRIAKVFAESMQPTRLAGGGKVD